MSMLLSLNIGYQPCMDCGCVSLDLKIVCFGGIFCMRFKELKPLVIYRKQLEDLINENGGEYRANLTKDITHLIAKEPSGAKYNYAGQWGIKTVSDEWLQQSLERGMILDESLYHLMLPATERGRNAWIRKSASTTSLGKRTRGDEVTSQNSRKLRRTASAKLSSHNDGIWGEINRAEINLGMSKADSWDDPQKASVKNADASVVPQPDKSGAPRNINENLPLKRSQSEVSLGSSLCKPFQQEAMFQGKTFLLCGFDETKVGDG